MPDGPEEFLNRSDVQRARRILRERWHQLLLGVILGFMALTRLRTVQNFITSSGIVFSGNDAWYHYRQVTYTVRNWPFTMPYDPWTGFPTGTFQGQFGTLYDQILATVALIVGLGAPSDATIRFVLLVMPAVFGALVALPTYYLGRELTDSRGGGLVAAGILSLLSGLFFRRTTAGAADHNAAEPLFMMLMLVGLVYMLRVVAEDDPVFEMLTDVEELRGELRSSVKAVGVFTVAMIAYVLVWPPAVAFMSILGVGVVLYAVVTAAGSDSLQLERTMIAMGVGFIAVTVLLLPFVDSFGFNPTIISIPQLVVPFGVGVFALSFAGYERLREQYEFPVWVAPLGIAALGILGAIVVRAAAPNVFNLVVSLFLNVFGLNFGQPTATIAEAQSVLTVGTDVIYSQYGLLFGPFVLGVLAALYNGLRSREPERFLLGFVGFAVMLMALSQVRFNYYLAPLVALFSARVLLWVSSLLSIPEDMGESISNLNAYQILTVLMLVSLVVPSILFPFSGTVFAQGNAPGSYTQWSDTLEWMDGNTPEEGQLGSPSSDPLPYYGTFERPDDYEYPNGTYGVVSWWDYGHWITATGERIPVANPFQQHATEASQYLLADSEEEADRVIDEELESEQQARYVVIDWKTAVETTPNAKFGALPSFHPNRTTAQYTEPVFAQQQGRLVPVTYLRTQDYYETLSTRLYYYHGSRIPESTAVVRWENRRVQSSQGPTSIKVLSERPAVEFLNTTEQANQIANESVTARSGGIGVFAPESVPALEHYRLVRASDERASEDTLYRNGLNRYTLGTGLQPQSFNPLDNWVKVFERVPGATIEGTGPPNSTVTASVLMQTHEGTTFEYRQQAQTGPDGSFTMTVPYSTTGYDNWGPEQGYTNVSTRANGPYTFTASSTASNGADVDWRAQANVSEAKVIGEDSDSVTVTLTRTNDSTESSEDSENGS